MRIWYIWQKYEEATNKLLQLGYRREALPVMKEHTNILHRMAKVSLEKEIRHTYYLQVCKIVSLFHIVMFNF